MACYYTIGNLGTVTIPSPGEVRLYCPAPGLNANQARLYGRPDINMDYNGYNELIFTARIKLVALFTRYEASQNGGRLFVGIGSQPIVIGNDGCMINGVDRPDIVFPTGSYFDLKAIIKTSTPGISGTEGQMEIYQDEVLKTIVPISTGGISGSFSLVLTGTAGKAPTEVYVDNLKIESTRQFLGRNVLVFDPRQLFEKEASTITENATLAVV